MALNHGHVLPLVAQYLIKREDEVIQSFCEEVDWFEAKLEDEKSNTGIRMFKRYAVITTSANILGRVLATDIDIAKIRDYFIDYHAHTVSERSLADKAIEVITQFVAQNRGKFSDDTALKNMFENYGLIALKDNHIEVKIIASVFKNMLLEHHFQDVNNVVNALRIKDLSNLTMIELQQKEQSKITIIRNIHLFLSFEIRFRACINSWTKQRKWKSSK